jgi:GT2 family glycosyltransferase
VQDEIRYSVGVKFARDRTIASNRCRIVRDFLSTTADYLLMIDNDQSVPYDLFDYVADDCDVLSFPTPILKADDQQLMRWNIWYDESIDRTIMPRILEVTAAGTGCILIARRVLEHPDMKAPFRDGYDEYGIRVKGEDLDFCQRARAVGFKIYVAPLSVCNHFKEVGLIKFYKKEQKNGDDTRTE